MNHLNHKTYQKARDLILASEGRTIEDELVRGCEVILKEPKYWNGGPVKKFEIIDYDHKNYRIFFGSYYFDHIEDSIRRYEIEEILGLPISLDRVLMALGNDFYLDGSGELYKIIEQCDCDGLICKLKLGQPLHLQPLETIEKIVEILEGNYLKK